MRITSDSIFTRKNLIVAALISIGSCVCICILLWVLLPVLGKAVINNMITEDPTKVSVNANEIINYSIPEGYENKFFINMMYIRMVIIGKKDNESGAPFIAIAEMQYDGEYDEEEMRLQMQLQMQRQMNRRNYDVKMVESKTITISGQETTIMTFEGTDDDGISVRQQITGFINGKRGKVMIMMMGKEINWDQKLIDRFLASLST